MFIFLFVKRNVTTVILQLLRGDHNHDKYFEYLNREIGMYQSYNLKTLYFGGGTPSAVRPEFINNIVEDNIEEVTIEFNPESKLEYLKEYRANRLSIGIQTFNDDILKKIGRVHNSERAILAYESARNSFNNISVDLMFALPGQTFDILKRDLEIIKSLDPEHISIYSLIWKEKTPFYEMRRRGILKEASEDEEASFYEYIIDFLTNIGYEHYEISSFSKKGYKSKHNLTYWKNRKYLGVGLGASGYLERRYRNVKSFDQYYKLIDENKKPISEEETVDEELKEQYKIILQLRLLDEGIYKNSLSKRNIDILDGFIDQGLLKLESNRYFLTKRGLFLSNEIFVEVLG